MIATRKHLSYANVMATLAVFVSLGGGALAALHLPVNSVGTRQLKPHSVTGLKVREGSLTGADFQPHSLTVADLPLLGLANLQGASGTATNSATIELEKDTCDRYIFSAPGAQPGDAVILQGSDAEALQHGFTGGPTVANPNQINVSVCAGSAKINQAPGTVQLRFDTLR